MPDDVCRIDDPSESEFSAIAKILAARRIAIVGLSPDADRPSHEVSQYLQQAGFTIVPVNPNARQVLGEKSYPDLSAVPGKIDAVVVFRRSEYAADVAREAAKVGAKGLWLQSGVTSEEARKIAREAKIPFVQDRCMMVEHARRNR